MGENGENKFMHKKYELKALRTTLVALNYARRESSWVENVSLGIT